MLEFEIRISNKGTLKFGKVKYMCRWGVNQFLDKDAILQVISASINSPTEKYLIVLKTDSRFPMDVLELCQHGIDIEAYGTFNGSHYINFAQRGTT